MTGGAPLVDPRDLARLAEDTRAALRRSLGLPAGAEVGDGGLVPIFARLAEIVVERINAVPDKNLLAFLSLVGVTQEPARPARVPLTFQLARGAARARVPRGTAVAATAVAGEDNPPVFETDAELVLTSARPVAAFVREPALDRYRDGADALRDGGAPVPVFEGDRPIPHELFVSDPLLALPQPKDLTLRLGPFDPGRPWPAALSWWRRAGGEWVRIAPRVSSDRQTGAWAITLPALPAVEPTTIGDAAGAWLRARLETPLPHSDRGVAAGTTARSGLPLDAAVSDGRALDVRGVLFPFGESAPRTAFHLACEGAFSKPGAAVEVEVRLARAPTPSASLRLDWSYWNGSAWAALGGSSPGGDGRTPTFADGTRALTRDGTVAFTAPADWAVTELGGRSERWLRASVVAGDFGSPPDYGGPALERVAVSYTWAMPRVDVLTREVAIEREGLRPDAAFFGVTRLDLSTELRPFGDRPRPSDVFYLAQDEAFSLPGAVVTLHVTGAKAVSTAGGPKLTWEVYDGAAGRWSAASAVDGTDALAFSAKALSGTVRLTLPLVPARVAVAGEERYWVRARLTGGDYGRDADFTASPPAKATWDPPALAEVSVSYAFSSGRAAPAVATRNDFRVERPSGSFEPFRPTTDARPTFYLGLDAPFDNDLATLFCDIPDGPAGGGAPLTAEPAAVVWEYRAADGWQPLGARDETRGLAQRGLLTFVGPADAERSVEFGVDAWWLRARWERGVHRAQPRLSRVLANTVWATHAQTTVGEVLGSSTGDGGQRFRTVSAPVLPGQRIEVREPGRPSAPELAALTAEEGEDVLSVVDGETWVRWHEVVDFYGSGPRSRHYVLDRLSGEILFGDGRRGLAPPAGRANVRAAHYRTGGGAAGNRPAGSVAQLKSAVAYVDGVANLLPAAGGADAESLEAVRARGPRRLRHGDRAVAVADLEDLASEASPEVARVLGVAATDRADAGSVGVVVVPDSRERQPVPSAELLERVRARLEQRLSPVVELWVAGPGWTRIAVAATVVPARLDEAADVQHAVRAAVEAFLHPLTGGLSGSGWPFGRRPRRADLLALIEALPGVDHVGSLSLTETAEEPPPAPGAALVCSDEHAIAVAGAGGAA